MSIPIDGHYIPAFSIEDILLDKDTGAPLSGGLVYFYEDEQRGTLKNVWQITGTSPNYGFTQLPNPVVLSAIGTFEDSLGNPVIPYFFPFDAAGKVELYYVDVYNSNMVAQFNREAQPYIPQTFSPVANGSGFSNALSNPQFATILFDMSSGSFTYNYTNPSGTVTSIAPDWDMLVTGTGACSVTLTQLVPEGTLNIASNPGTILQISSSNVSALQLRQRIYGSPSLWSGGNLSSSIVAAALSAGTPSITMIYSQSSGSVVNELLLTANLNSSITYATYPGQATIPASTSTDFGPNSYIDIIITIPPGFTIGLTSVQVSFTDGTVIAEVPYDQETNERQIDHEFHYYNPLLQFKPIPSYLVGWDFPLNPTQFGATNGPVTLGGANLSCYIWDQTILFASVDNSINWTKNNLSDGLTIETANTTSFALIQYLDQTQARKLLLNNELSVNVIANNSAAVGSIIGNVSLWFTTGSLPNMNTNFSLVSAVNSSTGVATVGGGGSFGTWTQIPNSFGTDKFTLTTTTFNNFNLSGFQPNAGSGTATFFAIVVSFSNITAAQAVTIQDISLVAGSIPTQSAPKTKDQVLRECRYFYQKSFLPSTAPVQNAGATSGPTYGIVTNTSNNIGPVIQFSTPMRTTPAAISYYNPEAANALIRNITAGNDFTTTATVANTLTANGFVVGGSPTAAGGLAVGNLIEIHWVADARMGIV